MTSAVPTFFRSPSHSPPLTPTPAAFSSPYYSPSTLTVAPGSPPQHSSLSMFCSPSQDSFDGSQPHYGSSSYPPFTFQSPESTSLLSPSLLAYSASEVSMTRRGSSSSCSEMDMSLGYAPTAFTPPSDAGSPESSYFTHGLFPAPSPSPSSAPSYLCGDCGWVSPQEEHMRLHYRAHATGEPFECLVGGCTDAFAHSANFLQHSHAHTHPSSRKRSWAGDESELPMPKRALPPTPELTPLALSNSAYYPSSTFSPVVARELSYGAAPPMPPRAHSIDGAYPFQASAPYLHPTAHLQPHLAPSPAFSPTAPSLRRSDSAPTRPYAPASYRYPPSPVSPCSSSTGLRLSLPTPAYPSPTLSPSQSALLSASSMNRLLSSPSSTCGLPISFTSPPTPSTELLHLHHTPASAYPLSPVSPHQHQHSPYELQYTQSREKYHIQPSAREERGHACLESHCGRVFKRLEHLRRHERTHTSEKPFGCDWDGCGRFFSRSDNLTQHKKTHVKLGGRNGPGGRSTKKAAAGRH